MTKHFFKTGYIVFMCITSVFSIGSFISGIIMDRYSLYAFGFGMAIITLSIYRDYLRETPRKSLTISLRSFHRVKEKIESLNIYVVYNFNGDWVEVLYAEVDHRILMSLLFRNQVKVHI